MGEAKEGKEGVKGEGWAEGGGQVRFDEEGVDRALFSGSRRKRSRTTCRRKLIGLEVRGLLVVGGFRGLV